MPSSMDPLGRASDAVLAAAVVAIFQKSRTRLLGTGAFVSPEWVVTARHVIEDETEVELRLPDGSWTIAAVDTPNISDKCDLAFLHTAASWAWPLAMQLIGDSLPARFASRGFQFQHLGLADAYPMLGRITGRTKASFRYVEQPFIALADAAVSNGSSGAPVLDPETFGIVAVIVGHLSTDSSLAMAVPFTEALLTEWPVYARVHEYSESGGVRFGPAMNLRGASLVTRIQRESDVGLMITSGAFRPTRTVDRKQLSTDVDELLGKSRKVVSVIGGSGVGKTTFLCSLALSKRYDIEPAVLVRGADIVPGQVGLNELIDQRLAQRSLGSTVRSRNIVTAIVQDGARLTVFLDGLNEANISLKEMIDRWIPHTLDWLSRSPVQLVVSCRPDYWAVVGDQFDKLFKQQHSEEEPENRSHARNVIISELTNEEAQEALSRYDLEGVLSPKEASYPFMLRIADELRDEGGSFSSSYSHLIERFILRKTQRATIGIDAAIPPTRVLDVLTAMADEMLIFDKHGIPSPTAEELFERYPLVLDSLVEERLLVRDHGKVRFEHDQVREYLQSTTIDIRQYLSFFERARTQIGFKHAPRRLPIVGGFQLFFSLLYAAMANLFSLRIRLATQPPSAIAFGLWRLFEHGDKEAFSQTLAALIRCCSDNYTYGVHEEARRIIESLSYKILNTIAVSDDVGVQIVSLAESGVDVDWRKAETFAESLVLLASKLEFSLPLQIDICRALFALEPSFHWRRDILGLANDIRRKTLRADGKYDRLSEIPRPLMRVVRSAHAKGNRELLQRVFDWLGNKKPIRYENWGTESEVGITAAPYAQVLVLLLAGSDTAWVCEQALQLADGQNLVLALASSDPEFMAMATLTRLADATEVDECRLLEVLYQCTRNGLLLDAQIAALAHCNRLVAEEYWAGALWRSRIVLESNEFVEAVVAAGGEQWLELKVATLPRLLPWATRFTTTALERKQEYLPRDVELLLLKDGSKAVQLLGRILQDSVPQDASIVSGILAYASPFRLRQNESLRDTYQRLFDLVIRSLRAGEKSVEDRIASSFCQSIGLVGYNPNFYFTEEELEAFGVQDAVLALIREGNEEARKINTYFKTMWPSKTRDRLLTALSLVPLDEEQLYNFVFNMRERDGFGASSVDRLLPFRQSNYILWDKALLTRMSWRWTDGDYAPVDELFRSLNGREQSAFSAEYVFWRSQECGIRDSASRTVDLSDFGKTELLRRVPSGVRKAFRDHGFQLKRPPSPSLHPN